jgi:hypothetical protein
MMRPDKIALILLAVFAAILFLAIISGFTFIVQVVRP